MKKYEQIDISGDVGLRVSGDSLESLFENAASGMYDLITDVSTIRRDEDKKIFISAENYENLLIRWLNELVFLYDTYGFTGKRVSVTIDNNVTASRSHDTATAIELRAVITGGIFNPDINEKRLLIKAATYHNLTLRKRKAGWEATVIFDI